MTVSRPGIPSPIDGFLALGIDAAWTAANPSGIALVGVAGGRRRLVAEAASVDAFLALAGMAGGTANLPEACLALTGRRPDVVAVDMPMSRDPVTGRREADDAVSRLWSARGCGTHTPNPSRPGAVGRALHAGMEAAGYPLATGPASAPCLVEVYPHPALVELTGSSERVKYKAGKAARYWRGEPPAARRRRLLDVWRFVADHLEREVAGTAASLAVPTEGARSTEMKAFEDRLDAVVCAWVGCLVLEGRATPYGDGRAAIWLPTPDPASDRFAETFRALQGTVDPAIDLGW